MDSPPPYNPIASPPIVQATWRRRALELAFFLVLFATYDIIVWTSQSAALHGVSLINYIVRDGRTDESAMYWPFVREAAAGRLRIADPYLVEHQKSRDIKPRLPMLACAAIFKCVGNANLGIVIIHSLFPAIAAMLLVEISTPFLGRGVSLGLTILSAAGLAFAFNELAVMLRITDLGGPHKYNVIEHLYTGSGLHVDFQRFFSPGVTLAPFLLGVWLLQRDALLTQRRSLIVAGLILGLHTEIYIHGAVTYGTFAISLIGLNYLRGRTESPARATLTATQNIAWFGAATVLAALPWLIRYRSFRRLEFAQEIMFRVGNFDFTPDIYRLPMLTWTCLAIYLRHVAHLRAKKPFLSNPLDLLWTSLVITVFAAGWFAGIAGDRGYFPCSHLVNFRYLGYLAPLMVAYPVGLLLQQMLQQRNPALKVAATRLAYVVFAMLSLAIGYGEVRAAINTGHLYAITDEMAFVRDQVIPATDPKSVIMTEDLRLTSYLVCESDRKTYIGYASVSLAPTGELIDRLIIPSIVLGRAFEQFEREHYQVGYGLPQGPNGQHWVLHHGGDIAPVPREELRKRYENLKGLQVEELFSRYRFDYAYFPGTKPIEPYASKFAPTNIPGLFRRTATK